MAFRCRSFWKFLKIFILKIFKNWKFFTVVKMATIEKQVAASSLTGPWLGMFCSLKRAKHAESRPGELALVILADSVVFLVKNTGESAKMSQKMSHFSKMGLIFWPFLWGVSHLGSFLAKNEPKFFRKSSEKLRIFYFVGRKWDFWPKMEAKNGRIWNLGVEFF